MDKSGYSLKDDLKTFSPIDIFLGQWKATRAYDGTSDPRKHSRISVTLIFILPFVVSIVFLVVDLIKGLNVADAGEDILTAMGILAAALIGSFSLLATWRGELRSARSDATESDTRAEDGDLWLLDSSSTHMLAGSYSAMIASVIAMVVVFFNFGAPGWAHSIVFAVLLALVTHVTMSLIVSLPGLYAAYMSINNVRAALNGTDCTRMNQEDKR